MKDRLIITICAAVIFAELTAWANTGAREYTVEMREYTVRPGQTLWGIATKHMTEQDKTRDVRELVYDIATENGIHGGKAIQPGETIRIPLRHSKP